MRSEVGNAVSPLPLKQEQVQILDPTSPGAPGELARVERGGVEAQFGPPTMRQAAIGDPPIERWDYPGFSVYFEYQYVIHSVVTQ